MPTKHPSNINFQGKGNTAPWFHLIWFRIHLRWLVEVLSPDAAPDKIRIQNMDPGPKVRSFKLISREREIGSSGFI